MKTLRFEYKFIDNSYLSSNNKLFFYVSLLHANKLINDDSLNALFGQLRNDKLSRQIKTFHSKINNQWYDCEHTTNIYFDILESKLDHRYMSKEELLKLKRVNKLRKIDNLPEKQTKTFLTLDETLKYLNKYLNKNKNFCIDHLFYDIIKNILEKHTIEYNVQTMSFLLDMDVKILVNRYEDNSSEYDYCCEYCCGEYDDWINSRHSSNNENIQENVLSDISKELDTLLNSKKKKFKGYYKKYKI